jgi:hypothetical protein
MIECVEVSMRQCLYEDTMKQVCLECRVVSFACCRVQVLGPSVVYRSQGVESCGLV